MAGDVSTNNIRIGATIAGLVENMKKASAVVRGTALDMNSKLTDSYKRAGKEQAVFQKGLGKLGDDLQGLGAKMSLVGTLPALFAAGSTYKTFGELEKLEKGLTRYGETIKGVRDIAKLPNVGVFDAAKNLIGLKAMKMDSDLATRSIKAMANAITDAGGSAIDLDPALVNLKQFKATKHINEVDLRQLSNRIPQTMDAVQTAFGTTDVDKLNKLGIDKFIEGYIKQLEKIPPVAGGAATAQEQLSDSFLFFSGTIGKVGDSVYGITDKITGLSGYLDELSDSLITADPMMLKLGLSMAALGVAIPIVVTAMGAVVSAGTALAVGLGIAGGTVAAVAAAVVIGGGLIITYWDDIKKTLTDVGVWSTLVGLVESTWGVISGTFKTLTSLLSGNWSGLWKGLTDTVANAVNFLNTVMFGLVKQVGLMVASVTGLLVMPELGKWIREKALGLDEILKKLHLVTGSTPAPMKAVKPGQQSVVDTEAYGKQYNIHDESKIFNSSKASINQLTEKLGILEKAYKDLSPSEEGYAAKKADLAKQVRQVTDQINSQSKALNDSKKTIKETVEAYVEMSKAQFEMWSIDIAMKYQEEQKALKDKIKSYKELIGVVANLNVETLKLRNSTNSTIGNTTSEGKDKAKSILGGIGDRGTDSVLKDMDGVTDRYKDSVQYVSALNAELTQSIQDAAAGIAVSFGEMFGDILDGAGGSMQDLGSKIFDLIGDLLIRIGKAMIVYSKVIQGLKVAIESMNGWVAIGIGVLAIGAGTALKKNVASWGKSTSSSMKAFAKGGFAYSDMVARVGDNRNARFDPEMIAPYSKVDSSIKKSIRETGGGREVFIPEMTLRGSDIVIAYKRQTRTNMALFGHD